MNRQYSGDTRDLFKIDLVCHIMKKMPSLDSFTFVPMLTMKDERSGQKKSTRSDLNTAVKRGKAGSKNKELLAHMARLQEIDNDTEYFRGIRSIFKKENILIEILDESRFSHRRRAQYFNNLIEKFPEKTLLLIDPDIGLETRNPTKRHLLLDEVKRICETMDTRSILMIYQHFPRKPRGDYVKYRCDQLSRITGQDPVVITDNEILFILSTKNQSLKKKLRKILDDYSGPYRQHVGVYPFGDPG
jgi:hypothetical protein